MQLHRLHELLDQRLTRRDFRERLADACLEIHAEDRARGLIGGADPQIRLEAMTPVDRRARITARFARSLSTACWLARRFLARAREPLRHVVERVHEKAHLVARRERHARVEVAVGDRARAGDEILNRQHEALRREERAVDGRQQRHQQHECQQQPERDLERLAQVGEFAVLRVGALHGVGELRDALGHRIDRDQRARLARRRPPVAKARPCGSHSRQTGRISRLVYGRPCRICSMISSDGCCGTSRGQSFRARLQ